MVLQAQNESEWTYLINNLIIVCLVKKFISFYWKNKVIQIDLKMKQSFHNVWDWNECKWKESRNYPKIHGIYNFY